MSNDITLTSGVRQNLLSLQQTASLLNTTQQHLATGKKVNSAFDNPSSFFTSQSLSNRASDLSSLLDQIGQAQQTLQAANQGLTSLTSLLQQALSTAKQAQQAAGPASTTYAAITVNGTLPTGETFGADTGTISGATSLGVADTLTVSVVGGSSVSVTLAATDTTASITSALNTALGAGSAVTAGTDSSGHLKISTSDSSKSFTVADVTGTTGLSGAAATATANSTDIFQLLSGTSGQAAITSGDQLTVSVNGGATQSISFGTGSGQVQTLAQLQTQLGALSGVTSSSAGNGAVSLGVQGSSVQNSLQIGTSGSSAATTILHDLGLTAGTTNGSTITGGASTTRSTLQDNFNSLLTQIDQLAGDSSYNGVNLLNGNNLKVLFNENGTSSLTIAGVTFNSGGLGLSSVTGQGWQSDANIQSTIDSINTALTSVRAQSQTFGTNSSTISTRQDFTNNLINTLQTGSDNLVLADQNQESANLLTLQTRQQLSISALSISNQASQAVLKLFP